MEELFSSEVVSGHDFYHIKTKRKYEKSRNKPANFISFLFIIISFFTLLNNLVNKVLVKKTL